MKLLVLGGTVFLGRHIARIALERGHQVTRFNRGQTNPGLFPTAEEVHGDRTVGLDALAGREWDAVIDTSGYVPRVVRMSAEYLAPRCAHYTFVSSISVYRSLARPGATEDEPVGTLADPSVEEVTGDTYGPLKALCEDTVRNAFPGGSLIVRPGLIVGPDDPTDRFTYWPTRVARGGEVLAPVGPNVALQVIDVRDLASWTLDLAERQTTGTFHATGERGSLTLGGLVGASRTVSGSDARITWVDEPFLLERKVQPWSDLPLWVGSAPEMAGFSDADVSRAVASGLRFRPIEETILDTLAWHAQRGSEAPLRAGLAMERERQLLAEWHANTH
jgi:2'-hydroxyisoflavone reductase